MGFGYICSNKKLKQKIAQGRDALKFLTGAQGPGFHQSKVIVLTARQAFLCLKTQKYGDALKFLTEAQGPGFHKSKVIVLTARQAFLCLKTQK